MNTEPVIPAGQPRRRKRTVIADSRFFDKGKEAILSISEAAQVLGRHRKTVETYIRKAGMPHRRIVLETGEETVTIFLSELVAWLDRQKGIKLICQ